MKIFPPSKVQFGYICVTNGAMFSDCSINYLELLQIKVDAGLMTEERQKGYRIPSLNKEGTHINLPTPKGVSISDSQHAWLSYLQDNQNQFEKSVKAFLDGERLKYTPIFPKNRPIENCICRPQILIPHDAEKHGLKIHFRCDWDDEMTGLTYWSDSKIEVWDIDMDKFF